MPNWAIGNVAVTGKRESVLAFAKRFVATDGAVEGVRYFARSFIEESRDSVLEDIREQFESASESVQTVKIGVSFAWSAYSCIISGYPQEAPDKLITLQDACKEDGVSVHITTSEYGMCFCEDITCDETGELHVTCEDMTTYRCKACGAIQSLSQWDLPEEEECGECGNIGFELVEEEQKTEKMEVISHGA